MLNTLEDKCKWFEKNFSPDIMIPELPVVIRLDGNNFSKWTKSLNKPFDSRFSEIMVETTKFLVQETGALIGYTQSDEITLILYSDNMESQLYNGGKKQKILSKLTGKCVTFFNKKVAEFLPDKEFVNFDCRIYQVPTKEWACNQLLWRENDGTRNSKQMLASAYFSHNELNKKNTSVMQDMLMEKGVNWNDLEVKFKRGTYIRRVKTSSPYTKEELEMLPPMHNARRNPDYVLERNIISIVDMPIFSTISNKVEMVFDGEEPVKFPGIS